MDNTKKNPVTQGDGKHADRDITSGMNPRAGGKEAAALHLRLVLLLLVRESLTRLATISGTDPAVSLSVPRLEGQPEDKLI